MSKSEIREMTEEQVALRLQEVDRELGRLNQQRSNLLLRQTALHSRRWIIANNVRLQDIQLSSGPGIPFFDNVYSFAHWMKTNHITKRFFEWNKCIYHRLEFFESQTLGTQQIRIEYVPDYVEI